MYTHLCLSIYLSIYLFIYLSIYLSIYLNIYGHGTEEIETGVQVRMKYEVRNMECGQERSKCCDMFFLYRELLRSFLAEIAPIFYPKFCSDLFRHGPCSHIAVLPFAPMSASKISTSRSEHFARNAPIFPCVPPLAPISTSKFSTWT